MKFKQEDSGLVELITQQQAKRRLAGMSLLPAQLSRVLGCHGFCMSNNRASPAGRASS